MVLGQELDLDLDLGQFCVGGVQKVPESSHSVWEVFKK